MKRTISQWNRLAAALGLCLVSAPVAAAPTFVDINPSSSDLDPSDPDGASSGRVNGLASVAGDNATFYAATEWGGIYKSSDGGLTWSVLSGHRPMVTWDVEVDPADTNIVYATSFFDGRTQSLAGINVSRDAGVTWTHPPTATPPAGFSCSNSRTQPSAFGISIRPDASNNVYVGTNCGLAVSHDSGATWTFVDPTPATPASRVWDVVVQPGGASNQGVVDMCGDEGAFHSIDGGTTWTTGTGLPLGRCSIAASPDEQYVLLVAAANNNLYESDDAGSTWTNLGTPDISVQGRIPFVETNQRSNDTTGDRFDLWYGDVSVERGLCRTPAVPAMGGTPRCPAGGTSGWTGFFTRSGNGTAHDDVGTIVFDTEAANDACPKLFSSDGGVYWNTDTGTDCQNPNWEQPNVTPHALWLFGMEGVHRNGVAPEDLYFGVQDDGSWGTTTAGAATPSWHNQDCCDAFSVAADSTRVLYTIGSFNAGRAFHLNVANPGLVGATQINNYPPGGLLPSFAFDEAFERFANNSYVVLTRDCSPGVRGCPANGGDGGVFITTNIGASPIVWTELGNATEPPSGSIVGVQTSVDSGSGTPSFYVRAGDNDRRSGGSLWRFDGTTATGTWDRVDDNDGLSGGFNAFAVAPSDPNRLYASNITANGPRIVFSTDGGTTWHRDTNLESLMSGGGDFVLTTTEGPTNFTGFGGYPQPSFFAFDPQDANTVVAGAVDSGVFISFNGGANWGLLTDPRNSDTSGVPHLPRPHYAYFDHDAGSLHVFVGTQGRGVWRIEVNEQPPVALCQDVTLDADANCLASVTANEVNDGSFDPDGPPPDCTLNTTGPFGLGPHTVTLTCVDSTGLSDSCTATVTVEDVTPPVFTSVPLDVTTASCGSINIGTPTATDNCDPSVTITSNAPARFPPGTTIVTWTATDDAGNVSTATQKVTVLLTDDPACCPAGTNIILGTSNNDFLTGTNGSDCILGRGAQDTINGLGGNDFISGGDGNDTINAGDGNDVVFGGSGQDALVGGNGADVMFGGDGDDSLQGGIGDDTLNGGQGQDILLGQDGNDVLQGNDGDDNLQGGNGNDTLVGGPNNDTCNGGAGTNTFAQCEFGAPNSCLDGIQDGTESDVDCGGACPGCPNGDTCVSGNDCQGGICSGGICETGNGGGGNGLIQASLQVTTDWGAGYCVALSVINNNIVPTTNWSVNVNIPGATTYTTWNGIFSGNTGAVTIAPAAAWNQVIPAGGTNGSIGFCANRAVPGSGLLPSVVSTTGTF